MSIVEMADMNPRQVKYELCNFCMTLGPPSSASACLLDNRAALLIH